MKYISNILTLLLGLISCTPVQNPETLPAVTAFVPPPFPTSTPTPPPTLPLPTETLIICDPFVSDFCITDGHFILQRPIQPPANDSVDSSYPYGSNANGLRDAHHGVEFANATGTPVYAAADGQVVFAGPDEEAIYSPWKNYYGNLVVIAHPNGLFTLYAHLSEINVRAGQEVMAGEQIGLVGSTGTAMGSHLHFEVRQGDADDYLATRNPELWLAPRPDGNGGFLGAITMTVIDEHFVLQPAEFTIDYYPDSEQPRAKSYYITTYAVELMNGEENAARGDLDPGEYRIALNHNGQLYERWVEVKSGRLTQVVILIK